MAQTVTFNFRFSSEIADRIQDEAEKTGLTANDIATLALQVRYGLASNPALALLSELTPWVSDTYPQHSFPADVVLLASRHVRDTPHLWALFVASITGADGKIDKTARRLVLQQMGRGVKRVLNAEVYARSLLVGTKDDIIGSYSLLRPSSQAPDQSSEGRPGQSPDQEKAASKDKRLQPMLRSLLSLTKPAQRKGTKRKEAKRT